MPYSPSYIKNVQTGPYAGDEQEIARKRKMAEILQAQSLEAPPMPQQGALSPLHILAKGLQAYKGKQAQTEADTKATDLGQRQQSERSAALAAALRQGMGAEAPAPEMGGGPAMPANPAQGMATLAQSGDPATMQMGMPALQAMQGQQNQQAQQAAMAQRAQEQRNFQQQQSTLDRAQRMHIAQMPKSPLVTVDARQPSDDKYLNKRREQQADQFMALEKGAESAYKRIQTLDRFLEASKKGTAGGAQPVITATQNFLSSFGYSPESLKNVAVMEQAIGDILGTKMQELGARGLTDKDMEILRQALPRVSIAPEAREAVVAILKKSDEFTLNEYSNARAEEARLYPDFAKKTPTQGWLRQYQSKKAAPGAAPQGVPPELWNALTPEERALWQN